jgi:hypothetical protein
MGRRDDPHALPLFDAIAGLAPADEDPAMAEDDTVALPLPQVEAVAQPDEAVSSRELRAPLPTPGRSGGGWSHKRRPVLIAGLAIAIAISALTWTHRTTREPAAGPTIDAPDRPPEAAPALSPTPAPATAREHAAPAPHALPSRTPQAAPRHIPRQLSLLRRTTRPGSPADEFAP